MNDKRLSGADHVLALNPFHDWWLTELRSSLAPTEADVPPPPTPEPEPGPEPDPEIESDVPVVPQPPPRSRARLAFVAATSVFVGSALTLLLDGPNQTGANAAHAASPPAPQGMVEVGEIQVLEPPAPVEPGPFDRALAAREIEDAAADAKQCAAGRKGSSRVMITFDRSGRVSRAGIASGTFVGTPIGRCISARMREIELPAFRGRDVTVYKTIRVR